MRLWLRSDKRHEQTKERISRVTSAAPAQKPASSTSHALRETPIELGPNPKKRLLRKPASSATSCSGQQQVKSSAPDAETEAPIEVLMKMGIDKRVALPSALAANTRRIIDEKSALVAINAQEGIDGYREKTMRTAHVEQIGLVNFVELSIIGHALKWARQSKLSEGTSLSKADGWNSKNHSHLIVARHLREKTHLQLRGGTRNMQCSKDKVGRHHLGPSSRTRCGGLCVEQGILNVEGFEHDGVDTACAAEMHRRWRNGGLSRTIGARSRINQKTTKLRTTRRLASNIEDFGKVVEFENSKSILAN